MDLTGDDPPKPPLPTLGACLWNALDVGMWGTGLYANDAAADLKSTVATLLRLPFSPDEIVEALKEHERCLVDPGSEDYTACWSSSLIASTGMASSIKQLSIWCTAFSAPGPISR